MTLVVNEYAGIDSIIEDFFELCDYIQTLLDGFGKRTKVSSTKLGGYKKLLKNLDSRSEEDIYSLLRIINKYNFLLLLKNNEENLKINSEILVDILKGKVELNDSNHEYNDKFFELEFALRLLKLYKNSSDLKIDLTTDCDIILNSSIAIEIKYIHSPKNLEKNVSYAFSQLIKRLDNDEAKLGIIVLDITNLLDFSKIDSFINGQFNEFFTMNEALKNNTFVSDILENNSAKMVVENGNFRNILLSYFTSQLEFEFYKNTNQRLKEKISSDSRVMGIVFQANHLFLFKNSDMQQTLALNNRALTYYVNHKLTNELSDLTERFFHSLAVGI